MNVDGADPHDDRPRRRAAPPVFDPEPPTQANLMESDMPKTLRSIMLVVAMLATACSDLAGTGSTVASAQDCRAYYVHTYRLDGMEAATVLGEEQLSKDSATCASSGLVTRRHFDCAMAARSVDALRACGAPDT